MIAIRSVRLRGGAVQKEPVALLPLCGGEDALGNARAPRVWRLAAAIRHELHANKQAATAHLADPRFVGERLSKCCSQLRAARCRGLNESFVAKDGEHRARHRRAWNGVAVGEAVHEPRGDERIGNVLRGGHKAERPVAARRPLRRDEQVGGHVPVVHAEPGAGATESGHHLVGDEEHLVASAPGAYRRPVVIRWNRGGERCAHNWLGDERGDAPRSNACEERVEFCDRFGAATDRVGTGEPGAIRIRRRHMFKATEPRLIRITQPTSP